MFTQKVIEIQMRSGTLSNRGPIHMSKTNTVVKERANFE